ncbi:tetratricopeptide repeat protein [Noviherbaspirillum aerium]|uniref:tetratricopeptide repeat protein n=1 Tax=Noviherbaspirillum aerium TaxID=2588497 RepID=UPI00178C669D|nr:tetratricopeptide repeat protein [Noviherbaspirillum aerium]
MDSALEQARTLFFQGVEHFEAGRLEQARAAFEASLSFAPGRPSVAGNLGITLFHLRRHAEAVPLLELATGADPAYADAWASLGLSLEALGRWPEATDVLEQAIRLAPGQATLQLRRAQCLLRQARVQEALHAFDQCLAAAPEYAEAWSARGSLLRELNRLDEAAACFEKALAFGGDAELNGYYLASVRGNAAPAVPPAPPRRYVEGLFDDYAADFQRHVVGQLRYQGYERLLRPLANAQGKFSRALDLGCGTGLCAPLLRPLAAVVDGVDISQAMLEQARRLGIYRELAHADIAAYLAAATEPADLVVAADVFIYVGDLADVFRNVRRLLSPSGRFLFTVEAPEGAGAGQELQLLPSLRYAHSEQYVRRLAQASGFRVDDIARAPIRHDQGRPVEGLYVYLA